MAKEKTTTKTDQLRAMRVARYEANKAADAEKKKAAKEKKK
jgi:hypothetical protein